MRRTITVAALAFIAILAVPLVAAVAQEDAALQIGSVDVSGHPDVRFTVTLPAPEGGPLPAEAFTITEDGEAQSADVRYADSSDLQVILLIDTTGSMGGPPLEGAKGAATTFLEQLDDEVGVAVLGYDTEVTVFTDFSATREEHIAGIDGLVASGSTAMYDAVITAVEMFPEADEDTSRAMVLLTDGEDNASENTVAAAIHALTASDVTLHSVEYLTAFTDEVPIRSMAEATGGEVFEAGDAAALSQIYQDLAADLTSRYTISYPSERHGPVEVTVTIDHEGFEASGSRSISLPQPPRETDEPEETEEAVVPPVTTDPPTIPPTEAGITGRILLITGASLWFVAMSAIAFVAFAPRTRRAQLTGDHRRLRSGQRGLSDLSNRASLLAERSLERRGYQGRLNAALERAAINLRPGEFIVLVLSATFTAGAVGQLLHGFGVALLTAGLTLGVARLVVSIRTSRRQARFQEQLGETLQLLAGSMRAGYSLMQAVDSVAREADSPTAEEFGRLVVETRLGRDMTDALRAMSDRMQCEDFTWVIQAIEIHREVGGDLSEVLDTVAGTIRERDQLRRQVQALSAEGKLSAYVLLALPFGVGLFISFTNPSYIGELFSGRLLGIGMLGIGVSLMIVGFIWIQRIIKIEY